MSIDKADWHWDDTEKLYRKTNNVKGELTEEQQEEIWLLASNHIGLFLRWLIDRGFNKLIDESDEESCVQVREGKMSGAEYLMHILDGAFCENDIKPNVQQPYLHGLSFPATAHPLACQTLPVPPAILYTLHQKEYCIL